MTNEDTNLRLTPEVNREVEVYNAIITEGEKVKVYTKLAKESLEQGDLISASKYTRGEFHNLVPLYMDCARLFEKIAMEYDKRGDYEKAKEHLGYAISSWTREAERLEIQNRSVKNCNDNISRLTDLITSIEQKEKHKIEGR